MFGNTNKELEEAFNERPTASEAAVGLLKFGTWAKTECDDCGMEYQVTRTEPREIKSCICNDCEIYNKAYEEGFNAGVKSVKPRYLCKAS